MFENTRDLIDPDAPIAPDAAVREMCARVFEAPAIVLKSHAFEPAGQLLRKRLPIHAHDELVQFDFALDCRGAWQCDEQQWPIEGDTLALFYPCHWHGYNVGTERAGRVLSLKLALPDCPAVRQKVWKPHVVNFAHSAALRRAWEKSIAAWRRDDALQTALSVAEILCLWPNADEANSTRALEDQAVFDALEFLEANLHRIVTLNELGREVHLSERHLRRRFGAAMGVSPEAWTNERRAGLARELLTERALGVSQIARQLGFASVQSFSRWFKAREGAAPTLWKD